MVLHAITTRLDTIEKIATATRKSEDEVRDIIDDLVNLRILPISTINIMAIATPLLDKLWRKHYCI
jgi:hypothetical protein